MQFIVLANIVQGNVTILGKATDGSFAVGITEGNEVFMGWIWKEQAEKSDSVTRMSLLIKPFAPFTQPLSDIAAWFGFKVEKAEFPYQSQLAQNLDK